MLTFTSEHRLEEIRWMPNGDLIGLRDSPIENFDSGGGFVGFSFSSSVELVIWSFPDFSESILARFGIWRIRQSRPILFIGSTGEFGALRGPSCECFRIRDRAIIDSRSQPGFELLAVSPDGKRVLLDTKQSRHDTRQLVEHCWLEESRSIRTVWVSPTRPTAFFYGPDNETLYRKQNDVPSIERLRIRERLGEKKIRIVEYEAEAVESYSAKLGEVVSMWQSFDGSVVGLAQKQFSVLYLDEPPRLKSLRIQGDKIGSHTPLALHPSNRFMLRAQSNPATVEVINLQTGAVVRSFDWGSKAIRCIDCSPDGTMIAAVTGDNKIIVWDVDF